MVIAIWTKKKARLLITFNLNLVIHMKATEIFKFVTGAALFSPLLATEDVLRYWGAPISQHGITKNDEGKGLLDIWDEVGTEQQAKRDEAAAIKALEEEVDNKYPRYKNGWQTGV